VEPLTNEQIIALVQKAQGVDFATGGILPDEARNAFIDATIEQSSFLKMVSIELDIRTTRYLDSLGAASRLIRKHVEQTASTAIKGLSAVRRTLTPVFIDLAYDISFEWLRGNIEKEGAETLVVSAFAKQFRNDLVDLVWNGDKAAGAGTDHDFLVICDGYIVRLLADADAHLYVRGAGTDWKGTVLPSLFKTLPQKHRQDIGQLVYFVNGDAEIEFREQMGERVTALGDQYLQSRPMAFLGGIPVMGVPGIPYGSVVLTDPKNLFIGFGWEMQSYRQLKPREGNVEFTLYAHIDANYALSDKIAYCE
jgi:hypothetical protein